MVFFSGTDTEELQDNAPNYNHYLSVIVNNKTEVMAKISFIIKTKEKVKRTLSFKNLLGNFIVRESPETEVEKELLGIIDMDIVFPAQTVLRDEFFINRVDSIMEKSTKVTTTIPQPVGTTNRNYTGNSKSYEDFRKEYQSKYGGLRNPSEIPFNDFDSDSITITEEKYPILYDKKIIKAGLCKLASADAFELFTDFPKIIKDICKEYEKYDYKAYEIKNTIRAVIEPSIQECVKLSGSEAYLRKAKKVFLENIALMLSTFKPPKDPVHAKMYELLDQAIAEYVKYELV